MKKQALQLITISLFSLILGSLFPVSPAHADGAIQVWDMYRHEDFVEGTCGAGEDTASVCVQTMRECKWAAADIYNNARGVCKNSSECWEVSPGVLQFKNDTYNLLIGRPMALFKNDSEVAAINACRAEHPKSEDANVQAAPDERERDPRRAAELERQRREELGLPPLEENAAPAVNDAVQAAPDADANAAEADAGGCSLQSATSPATTLQALLTILVFTLPLFAGAVRGGNKASDRE